MADVVVVDDDLDMGDLLAMFLRSRGHHVRVARDGGAGLDALRERMPDLVILDVEMPVMTGPDVAVGMLIHDCGLENVPVVLCSAVLHLEQVARQVGTPYFLNKPYGLAALDALAERALDERTPIHTPSHP